MGFLFKRSGLLRMLRCQRANVNAMLKNEVKQEWRFQN